ncbi:MAG: hypothetical protein AABZ47_12450 [Planctomycetota bacterium]
MNEQRSTGLAHHTIAKGLVRFGVAVFMILGSACVPVPTDSGTSNDNSVGATNSDGSTVTTGIVSPQASFSISGRSVPISIIYNVVGQPEEISSFYAEADPLNPTGTPQGERFPISVGLQAGRNQQFQFDPGVVPLGSYRLGILVRTSEGQTEYFSTGIITIEGSPTPSFIQPTQAISQVSIGAIVPLSFDAGDPENRVQWRLFYLTENDSRDTSPDELGTQLATGTGNVGQFSFSTGGLGQGDFEVGLSATDSGLSIAATVGRGELQRIVTIPSETDRGPIIRIVPQSIPMPPTIAISNPGTATVPLFGNESFTIQYSAAIREPNAIGSVDVFYDTDADFNNGFTLIDSDLPSSLASFAFPSNLAEGTYRVGAAVRDGVNPVVFTYASGSVTVTRTPTLTVTAPNTTLPIAPSSPNDEPNVIEVAWTTNVPAGATRLVDVFAQTVDAGGTPFGPEIVVLARRSLTVSTAEFSSQTSGLFAITVRITFTDGSLTNLAVRALQPVRVSSLPRILWVGSISNSQPLFGGAIFEGVNFEDNTGSALSTAGDLNGDGLGDFLIAARYGKSFFTNPTGIGPGEAYVVYGRSGPQRLKGLNRLNSLGTPNLLGVTLTGIRTPQVSNETDGMSSVGRLPDVDGDGRDEVVCGFPHTNSRGHNVEPEQNGVVDPRSLATLEREGQFLRGGVVIVSSENSILENPAVGTPVINLDVVGQDFERTCVNPEPEDLPDDLNEMFPEARGDDTGNVTARFGADEFYTDINNPESDPPCVGSCFDPEAGVRNDSNSAISHGFALALSRDYFNAFLYSNIFHGGANSCNLDLYSFECGPLIYCAGQQVCAPFSPGLHAAVFGEFDEETGLPGISLRSGFYQSYIATGDNSARRNPPEEPFGARIIGVGLGDRFGTSLTLSNATGLGAGDIIISAPDRSARGILLGQRPDGCSDPTSCGGEISGLESSAGVAKTNSSSGVAYLFSLRSLWTPTTGAVPPKPHQYIVGEASHCGGPQQLIPNIEAVRIAGSTSDRITNIIGIDDFNDDGRNDFAIGAPTANSGQGRVYVSFRRVPGSSGLEGDYVLEKLGLGLESPDRLEGALIVTTSLDGLGSSLASGVDFNGDGLSDLVIGSPNASTSTGEVIIVFGDPSLRTPLNGLTVQTLLTTRGANDRPRAARITGNSGDPSGLFGFNVANAGDVDGDGKDDLLIAAPNASPRFDPDPTDATDALTEGGLDLDFNGLQDDVTGPFGIPNGILDTNDDLTRAGIVYLISSRNRLDEIPRANVTVNISELGTNMLRGFMIVGRRPGDRLGGGDAGDAASGGIAGKVGRGRSAGLASAGDVDGDRRADILIGSILADPRVDPTTGLGVQNGGEAYLIYGAAAP